MPEPKQPRIVIFGATGRLGSLLVHKAHSAGYPTLSSGRRAEALGQLPGDSFILDLSDGSPAPCFIQAGDIVINCAHARYTSAITALCPPVIKRLIVIGSTRYLTRIPDAKADEVRAAARHLEASELPWVLLHPTMIYGAAGETNVQRMAALIARFHIVALPGAGRALIQPIHVQDVAEAVMHAVQKTILHQETIHLAGPEAVPYAQFLHAIATAAGSWVMVMPVPLALARLMARATGFLPGVPTIRDAEILRLREDKNVDIGAMKDILGVTPRSLEDGLAETFSGDIQLSPTARAF